MWNDGIRSPLVAMPQNDLGQRVGNAFNVRWQQLAGVDANVRYYNLPADVTYFLQQNGENTTALYVVANPDELVEMKGYLTNSAPNFTHLCELTLKLQCHKQQSRVCRSNEWCSI